MLKTLKFSVAIENDGKAVFRLDDFEHTFGRGLTAITGPNGTGKSMVPEMAMYALFGSKALRGKIPDYKKLEVTLTAEIAGKEIAITRSKGVALLTVGGIETATGVEAVNKAVTDLFGYSFDVFNIANAAKQGEIERLGAMKPAERKRLVDETVGVNVIEALENYVTGELRSAKAVAEALGDTQELPVEPVLESVFSLEDIEHQLAAFRSAQVEKARLASITQQHLAPKPVEPESPEFVGAISDLESEISNLQEQEERRNKSEGERAGLVREQEALGLDGLLHQRPAKPVAPDFLDQENALREAFAKFCDATTRLTATREGVQRLRTSMPTLSPAALAIKDIEAAKWDLTCDTDYQRQIELRDKLRETKVPHDCPQCAFHWEDADPRLAELENLPVTAPSPFTSADIRDREMANRIEGEIAILEVDIDILRSQIEALGSPGTKLDDIGQYHIEAGAYAKYAKYDELQARVDAIVIPDSVQPKIAALNQYAVAHGKWVTESETWQTKHDEIVAAEAELYSAKYAADLDGEIATYEAEREKHLRYKYALKAFEAEHARVTEANARIAEAHEAIDQWKRCREALRLLRAKVKGFLLPSLNRAASHLIGEMTGGVFSNITVSDEFEITVDGQRLETLSGGGKAVANLALRLALGQVLTNRVFSCVLLDEIDASCDDERAASMAAAVRNLSDRDIIGQIVLISHKNGIDADEFIRMDEAVVGGQQSVVRMEAAA